MDGCFVSVMEPLDEHATFNPKCSPRQRTMVPLLPLTPLIAMWRTDVS